MIVSMRESKVEVKATESFWAIRSGQPSMRHRRCFSNTSPEQLLSVLLSLKFYGKGGLMVDSTADSEKCSSDLRRPAGNFRMPMGPKGVAVGYSNVVLSP